MPAGDEAMRKYQEGPADRLWRDKLDACVSPLEAIVVTLLLMAAFVLSLLVN